MPARACGVYGLAQCTFLLVWTGSPGRLAMYASTPAHGSLPLPRGAKIIMVAAPKAHGCVPPPVFAFLCVFWRSTAAGFRRRFQPGLGAAAPLHFFIYLFTTEKSHPSLRIPQVQRRRQSSQLFVKTSSLSRRLIQSLQSKNPPQSVMAAVGNEIATHGQTKKSRPGEYRE